MTLLIIVVMIYISSILFAVCLIVDDIWHVDIIDKIGEVVRDTLFFLRKVWYYAVFPPGSVVYSPNVVSIELSPTHIRGEKGSFLVLPDRKLVGLDRYDIDTYQTFKFKYERKITPNELLLITAKEKDENRRNQMKRLLKRIL